MSLGDARDLLRRLVEDGTICPLCKLRAQVYKRPMNATMARGLAAMYAEHGRNFGSLPEVRKKYALHHSNQETMTRWWGLIEEEKRAREDGGRAGYWRVTILGEQWVTGNAKVRGIARTYDGEVLQLLGDDVTVYDVLGVGFNLSEVMSIKVENPTPVPQLGG